MASLRELRRRIKSVENIHGITKAMEIISAVRYKKIDTKFKKAQPYFDSLQTLVARIISEERVVNNPLFEKRKNKKELVVVLTGDRGLCGGFNSSVLKEMQRYADESSDKEIQFFPIGKVAMKYLEKRNMQMWDQWIDIGYQFTSETLDEKMGKLTQSFVSGEFDHISILSTPMNRSSAGRPEIEPLLGLSFLMDLESDGNAAADYIFEPEPVEVLNTLVDLYMKQRFFTFLLRSVTAEYLSRMVAMKQATDNGRDVIDQLTLVRNKVRQAMITQEISEIIGGSSALN